MKELWSEGTIHQKTRCWSQGMDGWRPVEQIAQLKWYLMATGIPLMNESEMAALILDTLVRICDFYPCRCVHGLSPMLLAVSHCHTYPYGVHVIMFSDCSCSHIHSAHSTVTVTMLSSDLSLGQNGCSLSPTPCHTWYSSC